MAAVTDMNAMFQRAKVFNQDVGEWDVSAVDDMSAMFFKAFAFDQNLAAWCDDATMEYFAEYSDCALDYCGIDGDNEPECS